MLASAALVLAAATPSTGSGLPSKVVITEFLADNESSITDEDGDSSDWLEVWNGTAGPRNLAGMALTDDADELQKWILPAVTLQPGEYVVIFASGKDRTDPTGELHTSFKLSKDGEFLALVKKDGVTVNSGWSPYPLQTADASFGLDAGGEDTFFDDPTPGAPNAGGGPEGVVADTTFSVDRGFFDAPFAVEVATPTPGASVRYTTDGSAPSESAGMVYTGPIDVDTTTVLRAMAFKSGFVPTNVDTHTYIFPADVLTQPFAVPGYPNPLYDVGAGQDKAQHDYEMDPEIVGDPAYAGSMEDALRSIPTLSVAVDPGEIFGPLGFYDADDVEQACSVEVIYPDDPLGSHQENAGIEGHSHVRLKRSMRVNFKSAFGAAQLHSDLLQRAPLGGATATDEFDRLVLRAGNNRSWARNWNPGETTYTLDELFRGSQLAMSGFGSRGTFVHLYLNGLYWGLYNVVERPDAKWTQEYFEGKYADWFANNHGGSLSGDPADFNWLAGGLTNKDMSSAGNYAQLQQFLDVQAFCDYMILVWWTGTGDWPTNNWYGGNRSAASPLGRTPYRFFAWDGEWSWDTPWGFSNPGHGAHVHPEFVASKSGGPTIPKIWHAARANEEFMTLFGDRVFAHLFHGGALTDENVRARFEVLTGFIREAVTAESARWGDSLAGLGNPVYERDVHWQAEIDTLDALMEGNGAVFIAALRAQGYYPSIDPPVMNLHGGELYSPFTMEIGNPNATGTVHYTLDGSDPRLEGGAVNPGASEGEASLLLATTTGVRARVLDGGEWSALAEADFTFAVSPAVPTGCGLNPVGSLTHLFGAFEVGGTPVFGVDNPLGTQGEGSICGLLVHVLPDAAYPCGTPLPGLGMAGPGAFGELLVDLPLLFPLFPGAFLTGPGTPATVALALPSTPHLAGGAVYLQGVIIDPIAAQGVGVGLTNGLELILAP